MAIGTPVERFVGSFASQTSTTVVTPTTTVAAVTRAIMMIHSNVNKTASSIVDSVGNTWTVHTTGSDGTRAHSIASCQVVTPITNADTITITWSSATSSTTAVMLWEVSGMATSSAFDVSSGNGETTGTTRTSNATAGLAQADELVVGITSQTNSSTPTAGAGFTLGTPLIANFVVAEYQIVSSTTGVAATFNTMQVGSQTRTTVATFKAASLRIPQFVGAGAGIEILVAGTQTVSKTGCTAGNFLMAACFDSDDTGGGSFVTGSSPNIAGLDGTPNTMNSWINATRLQIQFGRVISSGTVSRDVTLVAGGATTIARIYEFSGVHRGATLNDVRESSGEAGPVTDTTVQDKGVTTLGQDRLAYNFVNLRSSQAIGDFTGETGGDWAEAAEYVGSALTQQLQIAAMPAVGTIDGGTAIITSSYWLTSGAALIPHIEDSSPMYRPRIGWPGMVRG